MFRNEAEMVTDAVKAAEHEARAVLDSWWTTPERDAPLPVDPYQLSRRLGLRVGEATMPTAESGNIVIPPGGDATITINQDDHPNRQRFTAAHELGHYVRWLNNGGGSQETIVDYRGTLAGLGVAPDEIFANQFAAALLMPAHLVQRWYVREQQTPDVMARRFGTSVQAMDVRLRNLGLNRD